MQGPDYRTWLQDRYNNSTDATVRQQAGALLNVVGNDGGINQNFIANPYSYATQLKGIPNIDSTQGQILGYGPDGMTRINNEMLSAYNSPNRQYGGSAYPSQVNGASTVYGSSGGGSTAAQQTADERAAYDDQINALNQLLGYTQTSRDQGLSSLQAGMDDEVRKLNDSKTKAMLGYDEQAVQNNKDKLGGFNQVDDYANNSYKSLQRLLLGGNAGNSSVGRELMPYLVSKSAGSKRQGVVETAGANEQSITKARGNAEDEFNLSQQDLGNQRKAKEQSFLESILQRQNDLSGQKRDLEVKKAMANGTGYAQARAAGDASQASINSRMGELANLFGTYKPTYNARAMNLKGPDLSKFTVDKTVDINSDKSLPTESSYYQTMLNKKKQAENL